MNPIHRKHPELHGLRGNEYFRSFKSQWRKNNIAAGLTWDGKRRVRPIRPSRPDLAGLTRNARKVITNRERRARLAAQRPVEHEFIYNLELTDRLILRTEIDSFAVSLGLIFRDLSSIGKVRALELEKHLAALRQRFV